MWYKVCFENYVMSIYVRIFYLEFFNCFVLLIHDNLWYFSLNMKMEFVETYDCIFDYHVFHVACLIESKNWRLSFFQMYVGNYNITLQLGMLLWILNYFENLVF